MADRIVEHLEIKYGTQQKFDDLPVKSPDALYFITNNDTFQRKLTAAEGITIDEDTNTISATGGETIKNQNTDSSITKTYDWTGTLQEAIDQQVRELHPDWKIYITNDITGGSDTIYTKTEVDAGFSKVDMSNITVTGKEVIAHNAMPSNRYVVLTLGASDTTYIAPADGYFLLYAEYASGTNTAYDIYNTTTSFGFRHWFGANDVNASGRGFVPVKKDDVVLVHINGVLKNVDFKFIYAEGAQ